MSCASSQVARNREIGAELSHRRELGPDFNVAPTSGDHGGWGVRSGPCSLWGSRAAPVLNLLFKLTDINVSLTLTAQPPKLIKSGRSPYLRSIITGFAPFGTAVVSLSGPYPAL